MTYCVHSFSFPIRVPRLRLEDEHAAGFQHSMNTSEESHEAFVSAIEMYPF